jgi:hypothetical protein
LEDYDEISKKKWRSAQMSLARKVGTGSINSSYDSLSTAISAVHSRLDGAAKVVEEIETTRNTQKLRQVIETQRQAKIKIEEAESALVSLRASQPGNAKENETAESIKRARQKLEAIGGRIQSVQASVQEDEKSPTAPSGVSPSQVQVMEMEQDLAYIEKSAVEIVSQMKVVNDLTHQTDDTIQIQHHQIIRIDEQISQAHDDMVKGNEDLKVAEQHQKDTKCDVS